MNRNELFEKKRSEKWKVQPPEKWIKVSEDKKKKVEYYELQVISPDGELGTATVEIKDAGKVNEEGKNIENAKAISWEKNLEPFETALRSYLDEREDKMKKVFAIRLDNHSVDDEIAEVTVYTIVDSGGVVEQPYIIKRRNGKFLFEKLNNS